MKPFTYILMVLLQRADDALRLERLKARPRPELLVGLSLRKARLASRLRRSLNPAVAAWS